MLSVEIPHQRGRHGGARAGAGRPPRGPIASEPHKRRAAFAARHPVHITARVVPALARAGAALRSRRGYGAIERAIRTSLARADFRIVRLAVRRTGLELLVEADDAVALARGMQGFQVAAARHLNRARSRRGTVFADRYRARILTSRAAVRATAASLPSRTAPVAWPLTWLLRVELAAVTAGAQRRSPSGPAG